jgi:hypothetical protein
VSESDPGGSLRVKMMNFLTILSVSSGRSK